jgi:hypothetical protein
MGRFIMTRRTATNFVVDALAFVAFALLTATGLVERYLLPPGSGHFQALWGMNRHRWGEIHFWIAMALMAVLALHLVLHWNWIVCVVRGKRSEASGGRVALGVVGLVGVVGLSIAPFLSPVEQTGEPGRGRQRGQVSAEEQEAHSTPRGEIRGSMTLVEVERVTGVPAESIIAELGLPADVPRDETLGRLRRRYEFEMSAVRKIIEDRSARE